MLRKSDIGVADHRGRRRRGDARRRLRQRRADARRLAEPHRPSLLRIVLAVGARRKHPHARVAEDIDTRTGEARAPAALAGAERARVGRGAAEARVGGGAARAARAEARVTRRTLRAEAEARVARGPTSSGLRRRITLALDEVDVRFDEGGRVGRPAAVQRCLAAALAAAAAERAAVHRRLARAGTVLVDTKESAAPITRWVKREFVRASGRGRRGRRGGCARKRGGGGGGGGGARVLRRLPTTRRVARDGKVLLLILNRALIPIADVIVPVLALLIILLVVSRGGKHH
jgi:hypothetical protein